MTHKMSKAQEEIMLEFVMNNKIMITRDGSVPKDQVKRKWVQLAHMLNAEPTGVVKTDDKWKKSFGDWKGYVKSKAAKRYQRRRQTGTGVTGDEPDPLSELEEKLLFLTGRISAQGSQKVKESAVIVDTENINDADNSNNNENGVFSDDDEYIEPSTPAPTPTSSNAAQLFDRKWKRSRDKFVSRRMTITEDLSNKLIQSQQKQNEENERIAEAAENEVKLKQQKLENDIKLLELEEKKFQLKRKLAKMQHQQLMQKMRLKKLKYL